MAAHHYADGERCLPETPRHPKRDRTRLVGLASEHHARSGAPLLLARSLRSRCEPVGRIHDRRAFRQRVLRRRHRIRRALRADQSALPGPARRAAADRRVSAALVHAADAHVARRHGPRTPNPRRADFDPDSLRHVRSRRRRRAGTDRASPPRDRRGGKSQHRDPRTWRRKRGLNAASNTRPRLARNHRLRDGHYPGRRSRRGGIHRKAGDLLLHPRRRAFPDDGADALPARREKDHRLPAAWRDRSARFDPADPAAVDGEFLPRRSVAELLHRHRCADRSDRAADELPRRQLFFEDFFADFFEDFFVVDFFEDFLVDFFADFFEDFFDGTFAPSRRASESPMAIACLRLFTFLPELPLFSVPRLRSCIAFSTFFEAFLPYFDAM